MYDQRRKATRAYVASGRGIARVDTSDDQIGRFGLEHKCVARDIAGGSGRLLVATDEDVLVGTGDSFATADFGPAVAVGLGLDLLAAGPDGRVARLTEDGWETLGRIDDVRAIDSDLIAAADGVYHVDYEGGDQGSSDGGNVDLSHVGLDDARDVASEGAFAATGTGLYHREDGWNRQEDGESTVVASDGDRGHAVVDGSLLECVDGEWMDTGASASDIVDVAYDTATFAVTANGQIFLDPVAAKDGATGWRMRSLGLTDVTGIAVP